MTDSISPAVHDLIEHRTPRGVVVIAELGVNHDGRLDKALDLVCAASAGGADAVKLQLFEPAELCSARYRRAEVEMLAPLALNERAVREICDAARARALPVFATPFDDTSLARLVELNIPVIKIASGEVTHTPFLDRAARTDRPMILSTGACELADIDRAVATIRDAGCPSLSILHCVSAYPPPDHVMNLRVIELLRARYSRCVIGYSDHTLGDEAAIAAVALGARIIEKHLTLDCAAPGPDHAASADPSQFARLVRSIRRAESMLGSAEKHALPVECAIARSIVAARDLAAGEPLRFSDLAFKRAGDGVRPFDAEQLVGRRLRRPIHRDEQIALSDVSAAG
ncbi:MAG: N-acetylneuraminate synthase family protein [Phycisphaerales bacterium]|nr:N-acetylneuraminate synthase family protein [Phycisphaerales bacterium]